MGFSILYGLLAVALAFLLLTSFTLIRNRYEMTSLNKQEHEETRKISVCIPARNEEYNIGKLLSSLENQNWDNYEVHVLDDQSADLTFTIAESYQKKHPGTFFVHKGEKKPDDWLGKPWACHQLSQKCDGEILLFLDADTRVKPGMLGGVVSSFETHGIDMLTVWPEQELETFWEKVVIPVVYYALLTLLPAVYVFRDPRWLPKPFREKFRTTFAAACGQCIAFRRDSYEAIGGHEAVKDKIVEDVELAKEIKRRGFTMRMFDGIGSVSCRMYQNEKEIFEGLRKNFLEGFSNSIPAFIASAFLHLIVFVLPIITLVLSLFTEDALLFFLSISCIGLMLMQRMILSFWYGMQPLYSLTHPIGVLWFQWLAIVKIHDVLTGTSATWKGRNI